MTWQDKLSCILHRKKYPFISEPMTSHAKLTFFKSLIRDACREGFKYPEIFIPLSYLNLYSWLVCPAKSVFSVVYVLVDCLTTVCFSFLLSFRALPMSSQDSTKYSPQPFPGDFVQSSWALCSYLGETPVLHGWHPKKQHLPLKTLLILNSLKLSVAFFIFFSLQNLSICIIV